MNQIEILKGKTIAEIKRSQNSEGVYMLEFIFTDSVVLKVDAIQGVDNYLNWAIENN